MKQTKLKGVFEAEKVRRRILLTKNLTPGITFFEEDTVKEGKDEYRIWDPKRSKLAAAILKGANQIGIMPGRIVLYLGAAHGYTPSFVSDIVSEEGFVFALDFAPRVVRDLVFVCEKRKNIAPIFADANKPLSYTDKVSSVDIVYQDIAQKNQVEIFLKNCDLFLEKGGFGLLCVKARSIDITRRPKDLFKEIRKELEKSIEIVDYRELEPFEKDHCVFVCKRK